MITDSTGGLELGVTPKVLATGAEITLPYLAESEVERLTPIFSPVELVRTHFVPTDLGKEASVAELVSGMDRVAALIHLVGGFSMGKTHEYTFDDWQRDLNLNLNTTFLVCKHRLKRMFQNTYGRIVTMRSLEEDN